MKAEPALDKLSRLGVTKSFDDQHCGSKKISLHLRLTWNPRHSIGISPVRRHEVFGPVMMAAEQKSNYHSKKKSSAKRQNSRSRWQSEQHFTVLLLCQIDAHASLGGINTLWSPNSFVPPPRSR
jgi:hypothetical protein